MSTLKRSPGSPSAIRLIDALVIADLAKTKSEARRLIQQGGVTVWECLDSGERVLLEVDVSTLLCR